MFAKLPLRGMGRRLALAGLRISDDSDRTAGSLTQLESAWTPYIPTIGAGSGAFTTVSAAGRYKQIGKLVHFTVTITITTVGTAGTYTTVTMPTAAQGDNFTAAGRHSNWSAMLTWWSTSAMGLTTAAGAFGLTSGDSVVVSGFYEVA